MRVRPLPSSRPRATSFGDTAEALHAVRLLIEGAGTERPLPDRLVAQARRFLRMDHAALLKVAGNPKRVLVWAMDPEGPRRPRLVPLAELSALAAAEGSDAPRVLGGDDAAEFCSALGLAECGTVLLLPMHATRVIRHVLVLVSEHPREFCDEQLDIAEAFAAAVGAGLERFQVARAKANETSRQVALWEAARALTGSLDLNRVLVRVCEESARILQADTAVVYLRGGERGLRVEAGTGVDPEVIGLRMRPGEGLAGRVLESGEPMLTNTYQALSGAPRVYSDIHSALAVPLRWDGRLHGVLSLGWKRRHVLGAEDLDLLSAFGEIAATACRNAAKHEGLMTAARTDALTGCLNQAALHDTLRRELDRCRRTGRTLSLAIVDMDDFKQVNERHGHLAGDEVLRCVGRALRRAVRPYDMVARYGGDEFAIVALDTPEVEAGDVAVRAIERVARALAELEYEDATTGATAGIAEWRPGESHTELIARADAALLFAKHKGERGKALPVSKLPDHAALSESR
jgi:diguanylate cyclase (GGDEF)-like protein